MLHPTKLPDCADLLERVLDFQEHLLELGCAHAQLTPQDIENALGADTFAWLNSTRATRKLLEPIYAFARLPQEEKKAILADFRHDRQYVQHLGDDAFQFRLLGNSGDPNRERIKIWLVSFYDRFSQALGIDGVVTASDSVSKEKWWQEYSQGNGGRLTCAVCDGTMKDGITVEHYLPKSTYPVLAMHPYNLIPACNNCNNKKGDEDPLNRHSFQSVVMPYRESVRDIARLDFSEANGEIKVRLVPANQGPHTPEKINVLSELFDIPGQWQRNMREIGQIAFRRVKQHFRTLQRAGDPIEPNKIPDEIDAVCGFMKDDWGVEHYGYPATEWLCWANRNGSQKLRTEIETLVGNSAQTQ